MSVEIRLATTDDATLNADVHGIHANALPWRFKQSLPVPDGVVQYSFG